MPHLIERHWREPRWYLTVVLKPLSWLFKMLVQRRRRLVLQHLPAPLAVPIIVMGNVHVGGVGKTPMVVSLTQSLQQRGIKVGLISRGYGRDNDDTLTVTPESLASQVGDEPLLLVKKTLAPMVVASKRLQAALSLLAQHELDVIIADDGLQHYALTRQLELVVFPSEDVGKRLDVLPNGPLREPMSRLNSVNAVIISRTQTLQAEHSLRLQLDLSPSVALFQADIQVGTVYGWNTQQTWQGKRLLAVCGIGRPEQFVQSLQQAQVNYVDLLSLPDHALLDWQSLPSGIEGIITTEKDAVKWQGLLPLPVWVLPIDATIMPDLAEWVEQTLQLAPQKNN
ncbi:tetraacyldisaccharide 4'-kinase [Vitreoscilla massiliensis]|uniref:Tetraacyldisaccharide 4'-kinase n=1 Tax=Vitreoscilla massiliensis TaxID=1689272 RepID=A0ABY4E141_9NEIS|nr:tetraacyldisaccharide 4'-kinase [Vitreoscilla massiliensis]UOO89204.1 tetraacyldisaccharide 4'-kinase [Vitreoscilla massiliensis]